MDDNKPVLLTLHEALRLDLIEAYMAREITLAEVAESMEPHPSSVLPPD